MAGMFFRWARELLTVVHVKTTNMRAMARGTGFTNPSKIRCWISGAERLTGTWRALIRQQVTRDKN